jgi:hypothetical protein
MVGPATPPHHLTKMVFGGMAHLGLMVGDD